MVTGNTNRSHHHAPASQTASQTCGRCQPRRRIRARPDRGGQAGTRRPAGPGAHARPAGRREPAVAALGVAHAGCDGRREGSPGVRHLRDGRPAPPLGRPTALPGRAARLRARRDVRGAPRAGGGRRRSGGAEGEARGDRHHGGRGGGNVRNARAPARVPRPRRPVPSCHRRGRGEPRPRDADRHHLGARLRGAPQHGAARHRLARIGRAAPAHLQGDQDPGSGAGPAGDDGSPRGGPRSPGAGGRGGTRSDP